MTFVVKVPGINGLGNTKGCEQAGNIILAELNKIYSNEQGKPINPMLLDLEEIHLDNSNLGFTNELIYKNALKSYDKDKVIFLGGDHSISFNLTRAFMDDCKQKGKEPCLIVFDAHADCMQPVDKNAPTHEEWLRGVIEAGFPAENVLLVGARNIEQKEMQFLREKNIRMISINQILLDIEDTCDIIMEFANGKELYFSLDIDIVDPVFAPATGYLEKGGLTSRQLIYLVQRISKMKNLKAIDLVEINVEKDKNYNNLTIGLGAKILSEFL